MTHVADQLVTHLQPLLEKRLRRPVKPSVIRQHLTVFCNCLIENPSFDTQTKDYLTTPVKVGDDCEHENMILVVMMMMMMMMMNGIVIFIMITIPISY